MKFCDEHCSKERIKGYLMAPWILTVDQNEEKCMEAVAQMAAAIKARRAGV